MVVTSEAPPTGSSECPGGRGINVCSSPGKRTGLQSPSRCPNPLLHRGEQPAARPLAAAAGFGADPAVLVVMGVPLALIPAGTAGCGAGLDGRAEDAKIGLRLARHHAAGGVAQIGAVKT